MLGQIYLYLQSVSRLESFLEELRLKIERSLRAIEKLLPEAAHYPVCIFPYPAL